MHRDAIHLTITETQAKVLAELLNYSGCSQEGLENSEGDSLEAFIQEKCFDADVEVDKAMYAVYTQLSRYLKLDD